MNIPQQTNGRNPSNNLSCPRCHTQLPPYAVFCSSCGERVKKIGNWEMRTKGCPRCHTQLPPYAVFCSSCGERVKKIGNWEIRTKDAEVPMPCSRETEIPRTESA